MRRSQPLPEAHPELLFIETPGLGCEYRVENWRLSPSQHRLGGLPWVTRLDAFLVVLIGLLWPSVRSFDFTSTYQRFNHNCQVRGSPVSMIAMGIALAILVYQKLTQVLWGTGYIGLTTVSGLIPISRVCPCSPPLRHSARNTSRVPFSAILRV
jgi:hypothetical protein